MQTNKTVLLVEDDMVDAMTIRRAMEEIKLTNPVHHVFNGLEALTFLQDEQTPLPCIILLDINMPQMNGIEFLEAIKKIPRLQSIPVVVLTTSREEQDKIESFKQGVSGYMNKPVDYHKFVDMMRSINLYWTISQLPK